eukprot:399185-Amphidinium_carterae.1
MTLANDYVWGARRNRRHAFFDPSEDEMEQGSTARRQRVNHAADYHARDQSTDHTSKQYCQPSRPVRRNGRGTPCGGSVACA